MRVTDLMMGSLLTSDLQNVQTQLLQTQAQMASGHRINVPSDDPIGAENVVQWQNAIDQNAEYQNNAKDGVAWLQQSQAAMQAAINLAQQVRTLAVSTSTGTMTSQEYQTIAQQVQALQASLLATANTKVGDHYLFSGHQTTTAPFTVAGTAVSYVGGTGQATREVSPGVRIPVTVDGNATFTPLFSAIAAILNDLAGTGSPSNVASTSTGDLATLDSALGTLTNAEGQAGAYMQQLQSAQGHLADLGVSLQQLKAGVLDNDLAKSVVQFQQLQTGYQSALAVGAKMIQPTLANYLR